MSGVNDDCFIHYYIQQQNTSIGDIHVFPCTGVDTMADSSQHTQGGGAKVNGLVNQLSWEGPVQNYIILTGISGQPDLRKGILT